MPPRFGQSDAGHFDLRMQVFQEDAGGRMETQQRSNQLNNGRLGLQGDAWKIAVMCEIALLQMAPDAHLIFCGLQQENRVLYNSDRAGSSLASVSGTANIAQALRPRRKTQRT
jgi:hypothetical protein